MQSPNFARGGRDSRSPSPKRSSWSFQVVASPEFPSRATLTPSVFWGQGIGVIEMTMTGGHPSTPFAVVGRYMLLCSLVSCCWSGAKSLAKWPCRDGTWCFSLRATASEQPVVHRCKNRQMLAMSKVPKFHEMSVTGSRPLDVHTKDLERSAESPPFGVWQVSLQTF